jgi:hypothetical protein
MFKILFSFFIFSYFSPLPLLLFIPILVFLTNHTCLLSACHRSHRHNASDSPAVRAHVAHVHGGGTFFTRLTKHDRWSRWSCIFRLFLPPIALDNAKSRASCVELYLLDLFGWYNKKNYFRSCSRIITKYTLKVKKNLTPFKALCLKKPHLK